MRVALYCRVSTRDQCCDLQVRDLRAYCAARKFTIFREYIDHGESGAKNSRPELNNLMADASKRKFDSVIVPTFASSKEQSTTLAIPASARNLCRAAIGTCIAPCSPPASTAGGRIIRSEEHTLNSSHLGISY